MAIASAIVPTSGFRLLTDEDVPGGIARGLRKRNPGLDIVRVQEVGLMQSPDPDVLDWATREGRLIITRDVSTMTAHAFERIALGLSMLGVSVLPERMPVGHAIKELEIIVLASNPDEWRSRVIFLPL